MNADSTVKLTLEDRDEALLLLGSRDQNLRLIREALGVRLVAHGEIVQIDGTPTQVDEAQRVFQQMRALLKSRGSLNVDDVREILTIVHGGEANEETAKRASEGSALLARRTNLPAAPRHPVRPRTDGQSRYVHSFSDNDLVFCIGPAGTGKTYLAVSMAVNLLRQETVRKIVLVRPAVEAGERLGFLPGDIVAKVNPYLRPLLDALGEMMEPEALRRYMENDIIEIVPLAYMRGRTLNEAVIILDEGQNTTVPQMKMFLTRMGNGSKIVVTGDITQVDLPRQMRNGLTDAIHRLKDVSRIGIVYLTELDIVRHPLVQKIVKAYEDDKPRKRKEPS